MTEENKEKEIMRSEILSSRNDISVFTIQRILFGAQNNY